jgi:hypothetical protein
MFTSLDSLTASLAAGKFRKSFYQKVSQNAVAGVAGRWHELFTATGIPGGGAFSGTAGQATQCNNLTQGAMDIGQAVSPQVRSLVNAMAVTPSTSAVPGLLLIADLLMYYPSLVVTGTPTTLSNSVALPARASNGDGVLAVAAVQTAMGAAQPLLTFTFTTSDGASGQSSQMIAQAVSLPVSNLFAPNSIIPAGVFMALPAGKTGVQSIQSYIINSGSTTGTIALALIKPLATIPLLVANTATERDFLYQLPSLPVVPDDACLIGMLLPGGSLAAGSTVMGYADFAWG